MMSSWMAFKWISTSSRFRNSAGFCFFKDVFSHFPMTLIFQDGINR